MLALSSNQIYAYASHGFALVQSINHACMRACTQTGPPLPKLQKIVSIPPLNILRFQENDMHRSNSDLNGKKKKKAECCCALSFFLSFFLRSYSSSLVLLNCYMSIVDHNVRPLARTRSSLFKSVNYDLFSPASVRTEIEAIFNITWIFTLLVFTFFYTRHWI